MTSNDKIKHEKAQEYLQHFHECFYDYAKSNTAEMYRKLLDDYIKQQIKDNADIERYVFLSEQKIFKDITMGELEEFAILHNKLYRELVIKKPL